MKEAATKPAKTVSIGIDVDSQPIDEAIKKANRLVELLREAASIIDSLSTGIRSES